MLNVQDYEAALTGGDPTAKSTTSGANPPASPSPNFTLTDDPNVVIGKYGVKITKADLDNANKNGMAWSDLHSYADWLGGYAHKIPDFNSVSPYYRHYGTSDKINGADIAILQAKNDPNINAILKRNIAPAGEVPEFGPDDGDAIKSYINYYKNQPSSADYINSLTAKK